MGFGFLGNVEGYWTHYENMENMEPHQPVASTFGFVELAIRCGSLK
jgi:hypothetical protein